ncbi:unnamed protein product [Closterium sp. NIES-54]
MLLWSLQPTTATSSSPSSALRPSFMSMLLWSLQPATTGTAGATGVTVAPDPAATCTPLAASHSLLLPRLLLRPARQCSQQQHCFPHCQPRSIHCLHRRHLHSQLPPSLPFLHLPSLPLFAMSSSPTTSSASASPPFVSSSRLPPASPPVPSAPSLSLS